MESIQHHQQGQIKVGYQQASSRGCRFNTVSGQQGQIKVAQGSQADLV